MEQTTSFNPFSPADLAGVERTVEVLLPAHLLALMVEDCIKKGWTLRLDIHEHFNRHVQSVLTKRDAISALRCAKQTDELAKKLLHDLSPDDPREGLFICAMFAIVLMDEGFWTDPTSTVITGALLILEDGKDEGAAWMLHEKQVQAKARNLLRRANLLGSYLKRPPPIPKAVVRSAEDNLPSRKRWL